MTERHRLSTEVKMENKRHKTQKSTHFIRMIPLEQMKTERKKSTKATTLFHALTILSHEQLPVRPIHSQPPRKMLHYHNASSCEYTRRIKRRRTVQASSHRHTNTFGQGKTLQGLTDSCARELYLILHLYLPCYPCTASLSRRLKQT